MRVETKGVRSRRTESDRALAWFISPHGFGHAARASAIIAACSTRRSDLRHNLFTSVPYEFFRDSLPGVRLAYHRIECDVGMVQESLCEEDVGGTIRALERLPLADGPGLDAVVSQVAATNCHLVVSDIAPLGLVVADRLSLPGVLVENFTWNWIYAAYGDPTLDHFGVQMRRIFSTATLRIQTEPACDIAAGAHQVPPVSRLRRESKTRVRKSLGIPGDHRMVLLSVGGLASSDVGQLGFRPPPATTLVVPGTGDRVTVDGDLIWIPAMGGPYHPDLVGASDLVIGKLGYSTVAEVYQAGAALAYLRRSRFPECPILEAFVRRHVPSEALPKNWLGDPSATEIISDLLEAPRSTGVRPNGADEAAKLILSVC